MRLIDADALKEHIDKLPALPDGNFAGNHSALKALVNMQPTIEPSTNYSESPNGWIPVAERLPEKEGRYLVWAVVSFTPGHVDEPCEYQQTTIASYFYVRRSCWYGENVEKVIAWMPLPEPWKGE